MQFNSNALSSPSSSAETIFPVISRPVDSKKSIINSSLPKKLLDFSNSENKSDSCFFDSKSVSDLTFPKIEIIEDKIKKKPLRRNLFGEFNEAANDKNQYDGCVQNIENKFDCNVGSDMLVEFSQDEYDYLDDSKCLSIQKVQNQGKINLVPEPNNKFEINLCDNGLQKPVTINLIPEPNNKFEINLADTDIYTQEVFNTLLKESKDQNLPYFIVQWANKDQLEPVADAKQFLKQYYQYDNKLSPLTRKKIKSFKIYKNHEKTNTFKFFCDENTLRNEGDHASKYINACSITLVPSLRGEERYYLAEYYEKKAWTYLDRYYEIVNNPKKIRGVNVGEEYSHILDKGLTIYEKSQFWLNKSMEDCEPSAYFAMSERGFNGNPLTESSDEIGLKYLTLAVHTVSDYDERAKTFTKCLLDIIQKDFTYLKEEEEYCLNRLKLLA